MINIKKQNSYAFIDGQNLYNVNKYSGLLKLSAPNKIDFMNNLRARLEYKKSP